MDCTNIIITVISILLSGLFSWIASWAYYKKSNRDIAYSLYLKEVFCFANFNLRKEDSRRFKDLLNRKEFYYLSKKERTIIQNIYKYHYINAEMSERNAIALAIYIYIVKDIEDLFDNNDFDFSKSRSKVQKSDLYISPNDYDKLLKEYEVYHFDMSYSKYNRLEKVINTYVNSKLMSVLNYNPKINFFKSCNLGDIIDNSEAKFIYLQNEKDFDDAKDAFYEEFKKRIPDEWWESFLEPEGYYFDEDNEL